MDKGREAGGVGCPTRVHGGLSAAQPTLPPTISTFAVGPSVRLCRQFSRPGSWTAAWHWLHRVPGELRKCISSCTRSQVFTSSNVDCLLVRGAMAERGHHEITSIFKTMHMRTEAVATSRQEGCTAAVRPATGLIRWSKTPCNGIASPSERSKSNLEPLSFPTGWRRKEGSKDRCNSHTISVT